MNIQSIEKLDLRKYGYGPHSCAYAVYVEIDETDLENEAKDIIDLIQDTSWIAKYDKIDAASISACAKETIRRIVEIILKSIGEKIESDFGEYLISCSAQKALQEEPLSQKIIPLAELWKEKILGNPGFDFHMVSKDNLIIFGEAKYSSRNSPYKNAVEQISVFLDPCNQKHLKELKELRRFSGDIAATNAVDGSIGVAAAFSVRSKQPMTEIFTNAIKLKGYKNLLSNQEVYLIGIHIKS